MESISQLFVGNSDKTESEGKTPTSDSYLNTDTDTDHFRIEEIQI